MSAIEPVFSVNGNQPARGVALSPLRVAVSRR